MGEISNINGKISGLLFNSGKQKEDKELEHLKRENEKETFESLLENLLQLASSLKRIRQTR